MRTTLNYLSKLVMLSLMFATSVFAQDITNTLAPSGKFIVKDAANDYLTLTQSTGGVNILKSLQLENTTSLSTGVIYKGTERFIHNYYNGTSFNTFMGINAGNFTLTTANHNTGIGHSSLLSLTTGDYNTALGESSLEVNTIGYSNTAVGYTSLWSNTDGFSNTALGTSSLFSNVYGNYNTAVGDAALSSNTNGHYNTAVGFRSVSSNNDGDKNTALGYKSLLSNTTGNSNTASGYESLFSNTTGDSNTTAGNQALYFSTTGNNNTAVGNKALYSNTTGFRNTALGYTSGSTITTGSNLTCIGNNAEPTSSSSSDQITLGNASVTSLRCNVTTITSLSDARDKKNIKKLNLGIDFLMKIRPRQFNWDKREWYDDNKSDGSKMKETPTAGFIAQELDEAQTTENAEWLNLVLKDNPEKWEATPGNLLPIVVKAIQDLKTEKDNEIANLKSENEELKNNNEKLSAEVESIKSMSEKLAALEHLVNELASVKHAALVTKN